MDQEWVLDSLVGFLRGPLWSDPVFTFLDERSVVFDIDDTPENQDEYRKVYEDYKQLVNHLLDCHMRELSITPKQFEQAVQDANDFLSERLQQTLFEQIWAADHFEPFKRMMIQVNIDLQLWALEILAAKYGIIPGLFLPEGCSVEDFISDDDTVDYHFISSKLRSMVNMTNAENEKIDADGSVDSFNQPGEPANGSPPPPSRVVSAAPVERETNDSHKSGDAEATIPKTLPPLKLRETEDKTITSTVSRPADEPTFQGSLTNLLDVEIERPKTAVIRKSEVKTLRSRLNDDKEELDPEEIRKRQNYLRSQRDRLLKLKKEEREQQVRRMQELQQSGQRPPTAKFIALEKEKQKDDENDATGSGRALAYMRTLAARIKSEVTEPDAQ